MRSVHSIRVRSFRPARPEWIRQRDAERNENRHSESKQQQLFQA